LTIAERYQRGELTRDEVIQELVDYDYLPQDRLPDDLTVDVAMYIDGSWDDMETALGRNLIDAELYQLVLDAKPDVGAGRTASAAAAAAGRSGRVSGALREWNESDPCRLNEYRSRIPGEPRNHR
jgi:hypothetical protein